MTVASALRLWVLALVLWAGVVGAVWVENARSADRQQQSAAAADAATPAPLPQDPLAAGVAAGASENQVADTATAGPAACIEETGDYQTHRGSVSYVIGLKNNCEERLKCEIFASVTGARATALGHTTLILGATSQGAAAKKSYAMKVKTAGGVAQVSRTCRVL